MKNKVLPGPTTFEMPENRAKSCQSSGHLLFSQAQVKIRDTRWCAKRRRTSLACLTLVLFLGLPAALTAQTPEGSWSNLNRLKAGQGIEVIESSMKNHGGEFVTVTDEVLTLKEHGSDVSLKREDVARVSTSSGARHGEHAVIGLVVGGLIGAGVGAASGSSTGFLGGSSRGIGALVGVAIGAPVGAGLGAVLPAHTTIYRASRQSIAH
jgi:hypothetical protein